MRITAAERKRQVFSRIRTADLTKILGHRYGGGSLYVLPDDDAGRDDLQIVVDNYSYSNPAILPKVLKSRAPWLSPAERDKLAARRRPLLASAKSLAEALNLTEAERVKLKIRTIAAVDVTEEQRKELQRQRRRELQRKRRCKQTRDDYLEEHRISREKPWEAEGISRRTWYRRGTSVKPVKLEAAGIGSATADTTLSLSWTNQ